MRTLLLLFFTYFTKIETCVPGIDPTTALRLILGQNVGFGGLVKNNEIGQVSSNQNLFCSTFGSNCRWRNVQGIDNMDWGIVNGQPDINLLQLGTGTTTAPISPYAIIATPNLEAPATNGLLASDTIPCQQGNGQVRLKYWTSPLVTIQVCAVVNGQFPNYLFCSQPVSTGDPGPAIVTIPGPITQPFQIVIRAQNFVGSGLAGNANLRGGYAIVDDIEYYATTTCGGGFVNTVVQPNPSIVNPPNTVVNPNPNLNPNNFPLVSNPDPNQFTLTGGAINPSNPDPNQFSITGGAINPNPNPNVNSVPNPNNFAMDGSRIANRFQLNDAPDSTVVLFGIRRAPANSACSALKCSFNPGTSCMNFMQWGWSLANGNVGPISNSNGFFVYAKGPSTSDARLETKPFSLSKETLMRFSTYRTYGQIEVRAKTKDGQDVPVFTASRSGLLNRWTTETARIPPGDYEKLVFVARNLKQGDYIGLDELTILGSGGQEAC